MMIFKCIVAFVAGFLIVVALVNFRTKVITEKMEKACASRNLQYKYDWNSGMCYDSKGQAFFPQLESE